MASAAFRIAEGLWLVVFVLWGVLWFTSKRTVASRSDPRARIALWGATLAWLILFNRGFRPGVLSKRIVPMDPAIAYIGLALTAAGLGFAVWARFVIGRNWGSMITVQQDHQLMRTGPYAIVRHPIYSGLILATLGTAIIIGELGGFVSVALMLISWGYKSRLEESFMIEQFGAEYEEYRRKVKGLIPGIW
ncbi:MAG: Isoprenylcysteine carboxyl methyltransferase [Bryobacterales bacterium]|nr:Isoprenylcysteine carboxyl methyltransferase [Bryobacterales bacterium]